LTEKNVEKVRHVIESPERREQMVEHNYSVAQRYFSYRVLQRSLNMLITSFFGVETV
jgi:hypothetical protein